MSVRPTAETFAAALDQLAAGLRAGTLIATEFTLARRKDFGLGLQMGFDEVDEETMAAAIRDVEAGLGAPGILFDDDEPETAYVGSEDVTNPARLAARLGVTSKTEPNACPACGSPNTADVGRNPSGEDERLCRACSKSWVPARAQGG